MARRCSELDISFSPMTRNDNQSEIYRIVESKFERKNRITVSLSVIYVCSIVVWRNRFVRDSFRDSRLFSLLVSLRDSCLANWRPSRDSFRDNLWKSWNSCWDNCRRFCCEPLLWEVLLPWKSDWNWKTLLPSKFLGLGVGRLLEVGDRSTLSPSVFLGLWTGVERLLGLGDGSMELECSCWNFVVNSFLTVRSSAACPRANEVPRRTVNSNFSVGSKISSCFPGSGRRGSCSALLSAMLVHQRFTMHRKYCNLRSVTIRQNLNAFYNILFSA